jgi:hypothetical protein
MTLARLETITAASSFALIFVMGLLRQVLLHLGMEQKAVDTFTQIGVLALFFIFGFSCIGLLIHVFVVLQTKAGNSAAPMVRFMATHETGVTIGFWCFLGLGLVIALPFALQDMIGFKMPIGGSKGVLVADIGMTIAEVRKSSTVKIKDDVSADRDGSTRIVEQKVFDYKVGTSAVHFPESRYYWIETGKKNDPKIVALNIGITPRKMPMPELKVFQHRLQTDLFNDGWIPGHYVAQTEETVHRWSGERTTGDGRFWLRGDTVLIFETNRMDEQKRDEPPGSGEYILYLDLRPKKDQMNSKGTEPKMVFEPSAWKR